MTEPAEFIDASLQREAEWYRAEDDRERVGGPLELRFYGASVGAVRGSVRDALRRYRDLGHDEVTALASELWNEPVFERRLAAIVLLQTRLDLLVGTDLTRLEGFVRSAGVRALVDPLATDVLGPLLERLTGQGRSRAEAALDRWAREDPWLARAALLSPVRALRSGDGDATRFVRRASVALAGKRSALPREAIQGVLTEFGASRPELSAALDPPD